MSKTIFDNELCIGCGLCESITEKKVVLQLNPDGFLSPQIINDVSKKELKLVEDCCPAYIIHKDKSLRASNTDPFWGDYYQCFIGSAKADNIEEQASSGGIISATLIYLLENKIIDYAIHIGTDANNPLQHKVKLSSTAKEVIENADSRYAPSMPLQNILQVLKKDKHYAFVGKPCDVAALRRLSKFNDLVKNQIKYYLSFFCFGVPSLNQTKKLIKQLGVRNDEIKSIDYRKEGWPGSFVIQTHDGKQYSKPYKDYMNFLFSDIYLRCKICPEGLGESADITSGDGWSDFDEKGYPTFQNERGKSIVFSKTEKGNELLNRIIESESIVIHKKVTDLREIDKVQPGQFGKKKFHVYRIWAFRLSLKKFTKFDKYIYRDIHKLEKVGLRKAISQTYGTWKRINLKK